MSTTLLAKRMRNDRNHDGWLISAVVAQAATLLGAEPRKVRERAGEQTSRIGDGRFQHDCTPEWEMEHDVGWPISAVLKRSAAMLGDELSPHFNTPQRIDRPRSCSCRPSDAVGCISRLSSLTVARRFALWLTVGWDSDRAWSGPKQTRPPSPQPPPHFADTARTLFQIFEFISLPSHLIQLCSSFFYRAWVRLNWLTMFSWILPFFCFIRFHWVILDNNVFEWITLVLSDFLTTA